MGSKKITTNTTQQTQAAKPLDMVMPGFQQIADRTNAALQQVPTAGYAGDFVATAGANQLDNLLASYGRNAADAAGYGRKIDTVAERLAEPISFQQTQAPALRQFQGDNGGGRLDAAIRASFNPIVQQLQENILPGIRSSALDSGAYSSDRAMRVLPAEAISDAMESGNRVAAGLAYDGFQQEEGRQLAGLNSYQDQLLRSYDQDTQRTLGAGELQTRRNSMLPDMYGSAMQMRGGESDLLKMLMEAEMGNRQGGLNNAMARDEYNAQQPFRGLDTAANILTRLSQGYGTTDSNGTSRTVERTGGLGSVVQGALGLASMAAGAGLFGGIGGAVPGAVTSGGAAAGGLGAGAANIFANFKRPGG
jgi:hypothetical protein